MGAGNKKPSYTPTIKKRAFWSEYFLPKMQSTISTFRYLFLFVFGTSASLANITFAGKISLLSIAFLLSYFIYKSDQSYLKKKRTLLTNQKWKYTTPIENYKWAQLNQLKSSITSQQMIEKIIFLVASLIFQYLVFFDITYIASLEFGLQLQKPILMLISALLSTTCVILDKKSIIDQQQKLNTGLFEQVYKYFKHSSITKIETEPPLHNKLTQFIGPICIITLYTLIQYFLFSETMQALIVFYASSSTLLCMVTIGTLIYKTWTSPTWYQIAVSALYALTTSISFTLVGSTLLHDIFHYADNILQMPARFNSLLICSNILGISYGVANYNMHSRELLIKDLAEKIVATESINPDNEGPNKTAGITA
ncbi:MAG TPA: hypothetical protein QF353_01395 [Gammaproteobacteria bacterium]|nr:hypothetical protein [Gammaproteobacteria bacterium]